MVGTLPSGIRLGILVNQRTDNALDKTTETLSPGCFWKHKYLVITLLNVQRYLVWRAIQLDIINVESACNYTLPYFK